MIKKNEMNHSISTLKLSSTSSTIFAMMYVDIEFLAEIDEEEEKRMWELQAFINDADGKTRS